MSQAVKLLHQLVSDDELYLGPARVTGVDGVSPRIRLHDGREVTAAMALAFPYAFATDDVLLVIGRDGQHYVIGVLESHGEVALRFQGNVRLHAVGGSLELVADERLAMRAPEMKLGSKIIRVFAESLHEKVQNLYQTVRGDLQVHAGEKHEVVLGESHTRAERASLLTRGVVTINGKEVHLN